MLTHDDGNHTGALAEVLEATPQARLVTQFVGLARLANAHHIPVNRGDIRNAGDRFEITGVHFCADSFGALLPDITEDMEDMPESAFYDGFYLFNRLNHPWFALLDPAKFEATVKAVSDLQPQALASCHAPMARNQRVSAHLKAMASIASMEPLTAPDQAALEGVLALIQGGSAHGE